VPLPSNVVGQKNFPKAKAASRAFALYDINPTINRNYKLSALYFQPKTS
jgi:hypothetical protein